MVKQKQSEELFKLFRALHINDEMAKMWFRTGIECSKL